MGACHSQPREDFETTKEIQLRQHMRETAPRTITLKRELPKSPSSSSIGGSSSKTSLRNENDQKNAVYTGLVGNESTAEFFNLSPIPEDDLDRLEVLNTVEYVFLIL